MAKILGIAGGTASGILIWISFFINQVNIAADTIPRTNATNNPLLPIYPTGTPVPDSPLTNGVTIIKEEFRTLRMRNSGLPQLSV